MKFFSVVLIKTKRYKIKELINNKAHDIDLNIYKFQY